MKSLNRCESIGIYMETRTYTLLAVAIAVVITAMYGVNVAHAQQSYPTYNLTAIWGTVTVAPWPSTWWNPFAPANILPGNLYMPIADYNDPTGQWWPVLAENWTVFPQNQTLIIYFRHDIYWFNGTAVIPFTAWDAYAFFYITDKAFQDWEPWLMPQNADKDLIVLNNYTLSIHFDYWSSTGWYWLLMERIVNTPWPVWEKVVEELKTMNASQAWTFGQDNISKIVVPLWSLAPYYAKWSTNPTSIVFVLEPMYFDGKPLLATWNKIIPFHTWQYYPQITVYRVHQA